jgi:hypothetical protein
MGTAPFVLSEVRCHTFLNPPLNLPSSQIRSPQQEGSPAKVRSSLAAVIWLFPLQRVFRIPVGPRIGTTSKRHTGAT